MNSVAEQEDIHRASECVVCSGVDQFEGLVKVFVVVHINLHGWNSAVMILWKQS